MWPGRRGDPAHRAEPENIWAMLHARCAVWALDPLGVLLWEFQKETKARKSIPTST